MSERPVHLYMIAYSEASIQAISPGYKVLDNRHDDRHDWREYWPIRRFLRQGALDEGAHYGFFSPKFPLKVGLSHQQVVDFVLGAPERTQVVTFSPQADMASLFLNVFEQNELFDPGFLETAQAFVREAGLDVNLSGLVMDSRQVVFSNFIVAKPAFWRAWLAINERLFDLCEGDVGSTLRERLVAETSYPGAVQRKVFLMERLASLILATQPHWHVHAYNPFRCAWSATPLGGRQLEAVLSDALKIAMREQGYPEYAAAFAEVRDRLRQPS
jgi:hypothetical protein